MVHSMRVPAKSIAVENRLFRNQALRIVSVRQVGDFQRPDLPAVPRKVVLRIAKELSFVLKDAAAGSRQVRVGVDDGTSAMLIPRSLDSLGPEQTEKVARRVGNGEEPPTIMIVNQR